MKTVGDDGWFVYFWLYAPLQPFFDKTFKLPDFQRLDWGARSESFATPLPRPPGFARYAAVPNSSPRNIDRPTSLTKLRKAAPRLKFRECLSAGSNPAGVAKICDDFDRLSEADEFLGPLGPISGGTPALLAKSAEGASSPGPSDLRREPAIPR